MICLLIFLSTRRCWPVKSTIGSLPVSLHSPWPCMSIPDAPHHTSAPSIHRPSASVRHAILRRATSFFLITKNFSRHISPLLWDCDGMAGRWDSSCCLNKQSSAAIRTVFLGSWNILKLTLTKLSKKQLESSLKAASKQLKAARSNNRSLSAGSSFVGPKIGLLWFESLDLNHWIWIIGFESLDLNHLIFWK